MPTMATCTKPIKEAFLNSTALTIYFTTFIYSLAGLDKKKRNEMRESFPKRFHPPASTADAKSVRSSHSVNSRTLPGFRTTANQFADDLKSNTSRQWKQADTQKIAAHSMFKDAFPKSVKSQAETPKPELTQ